MILIRLEIMLPKYFQTKRKATALDIYSLIEKDYILTVPLLTVSIDF